MGEGESWDEHGSECCGLMSVCAKEAFQEKRKEKKKGKVCGLG
jgi:hypothetical protein